MIGLLDCNNFYVSCERLFNRKLLNRPVVVLSNNDGCIISRSNEAKKLGIKMGEPFFKIKRKLKNQGVYICSSNYPFYGDISKRVMSIIMKECPNIEIYSIDETFIDLQGIKEDESFCFYLREKIFKWTGIPVSIGIAKTKTLAKVANRVVKKNEVYKLDFKFKDVFKFSSEEQVVHILRKTNIEDIWGVGRSLTRYFKEKGMKSALDFKNVSENFARKEKGILIERTILELRGIKCYNIEKNKVLRKSICVSRSFGKRVNSYEKLKSALIVYVQKASEKLRKNKLFCKSLTVFLETSQYEKNYYTSSKSFLFLQETEDSRIIWKKSEYLLSKIYINGLKYSKIGVVLFNLCKENSTQRSLFENNSEKERDDSTNLMIAMDNINKKFGSGKLRISSDKKGLFHQNKFKRKIKEIELELKSDYCSPCYTTRWCDIPEVTII